MRGGIVGLVDVRDCGAHGGQCAAEVAPASSLFECSVRSRARERRTGGTRGGSSLTACGSQAGFRACDDHLHAAISSGLGVVCLLREDARDEGSWCTSLSGRGLTTCETGLLLALARCLSTGLLGRHHRHICAAPDTPSLVGERVVDEASGCRMRVSGDNALRAAGSASTAMYTP